MQSIPDPRVIVALRAGVLKRQFTRQWSGRFGACIPTFDLSTAYNSAEAARVLQAENCLDNVVAQADAAGARLAPPPAPPP